MIARAMRDGGFLGRVRVETLRALPDNRYTARVTVTYRGVAVSYRVKVDSQTVRVRPA